MISFSRVHFPRLLLHILYELAVLKLLQGMKLSKWLCSFETKLGSTWNPSQQWEDSSNYREIKAALGTSCSRREYNLINSYQIMDLCIPSLLSKLRANFRFRLYPSCMNPSIFTSPRPQISTDSKSCDSCQLTQTWTLNDEYCCMSTRHRIGAMFIQRARWSAKSWQEQAQ